MKTFFKATAMTVLLLGLLGCSHKNGKGNPDDDKEPTDEEPTDEEPTDEEPTDESPTDESPTDDSATSDSATDDSEVAPVPTDDTATYDNASNDASFYDAGEAGYEGIFDADHLPSFYLTVSQAALDALAIDSDEYQPANFRYVSEDGTEEIYIKNVGIRLKGNYSFLTLDEKAAFKVRFSAFVPGQRFRGLRRLTLNNMYQDPSTVRERLAYLVYREAGVTSPLCNHARVYLNGAYYGLFANVQSIDESFLEQHYPSPDGNLYDTILDDSGSPNVDVIPEDLQWFEPDTNGNTNDGSDLANLAAVLAGPAETFYADVQQVLDMGSFLRMAAVQAVIADWDSYCGNINNYKLYHALEDNRFVFYPWGTDQTFNIWGFGYSFLDYPIHQVRERSNNGIIFEKCKADPECNALYLDMIDEVVSLFYGLDLMPLLDEILTQVTDAVTEDVRTQRLPHHALADFETSVEVVREFIEQRGALVRTQLAAAQSPAE